MKKRIYAILGLLIPAMAVAENTPVKYADAANLTIVNKAQPGGSAFQRIEVARYPELTPTVTRYYRYSTGLAVAFRTDSRTSRAGGPPSTNSPEPIRRSSHSAGSTSTSAATANGSSPESGCRANPERSTKPPSSNTWIRR